MPRAIGYGRVSTDMQECSEHEQRRVITEYCSKFLPDIPLLHIFVDSDESRSVPFMQRPQAQLLAHEIKAGDHLIIQRIDRFGGSPSFLSDFHQTCKSLGIRIHIATQPGLDFDNAVGSLMLSTFGHMSQLERDLIAMRTRETHHYRLRQGQPVNRHSPIGWKRSSVQKNPTYDVDAEEMKRAIEVARFFAVNYPLYKSSFQLAKAAKACGLKNTRGKPYSRSSLEGIIWAVRNKFPGPAGITNPLGEIIKADFEIPPLECWKVPKLSVPYEQRPTTKTSSRAARSLVDALHEVGSATYGLSQQGKGRLVASH